MSSYTLVDFVECILNPAFSDRVRERPLLLGLIQDSQFDSAQVERRPENFALSPYFARQHILFLRVRATGDMHSMSACA